MANGGDDFWGDQADWTGQTPRRPARQSRGGSVSRWWNNVVGGSATASRTHGGTATDPHAQPNHDQFADDQFADENFADGQFDEDTDGDDVWVTEPAAAPRPGIDPLLARLGGTAMIVTLLVPALIAFGSRHHDPAASQLAIAPVTVVATAAATPAAASAAETVALVAATPVADVAAPAAATPVMLEVSAHVMHRPACFMQYTVVDGDYWIRIADAAGVSVSRLLQANDASSDTPLHPGSVICLPYGAKKPARPAPAAKTVATTSPTTAKSPAGSTKSRAAKAAAELAQPKPATAPATTVAPPRAARLSTAEVQQIIRDVWPDDLEDKAIMIAQRESNQINTARNRCCIGLFQLNFNAHKRWLAGVGVTTPDQLLDAKVNAVAAYVLYQRSGGWGPWS